MQPFHTVHPRILTSNAGDCRVLNTVLLLPDTGPRPRLHQYRSGAVYDGWFGRLMRIYSLHANVSLQVPIYVVAFVMTAISGFVGDKIPQWRGVMIATWLSFSMVTSILVCVIFNFQARYALLVLMAMGLWASNALSLSFASSSFGSMNTEVRAIALTLMNGMGNLAQIYGAYLFPAADAPKYLRGFGVISGMLGFGIGVYITMHLLVRRWKP